MAHQRVVLVEEPVVALENLYQAVLFILSAGVVVDVGVEERRHAKLGVPRPKQAVIADGLRNARRGENRVEPAGLGAHRPAIGYVLHHLLKVLGLPVPSVPAYWLAGT